MELRSSGKAGRGQSYTQRRGQWTLDSHSRSRVHELIAGAFLVFLGRKSKKHIRQRDKPGFAKIRHNYRKHLLVRQWEKKNLAGLHVIL
jgi:hypothetical protein